MRYASVDPCTGIEHHAFATAPDHEVEAAVVAAVGAAARARAQPPAARAPRLRALAGLLEREAARLARLAASEMGKPLAQGEAEVRKCAQGLRWVADEGPGLLAPEPRPADGHEAFARHEPLGPLLGLMPWNFPFWQVLRFAGPALLAGNTVLLKHAPSVPRCALALEALLHESGLGEGAYANLFLAEAQAAALVVDPRVRGVSLTGSTRAGRAVGALAGGALKPCVLELGGSDPFIVFADAPLGEVVAAAVEARCQNSGQSCIAAKRFLVQQPAYAAFRDAFAAALGALRMGSPLDPATQVGPLARVDLRDHLAAQVQASVALGARAVVGGRVPPGPGAWYPPTLLEQVPPGAPAATEELFGPVAVLACFEDEEQALALAHATPYGLGASVWTADLARARRMLARLEAGSVFANGIVRSDPRWAFGGVRDSGLGRELGPEGLRAFTSTKTAWLR
ncbi:MAG: aldehyde dehydrogenase family protein [Planctomycetia bacterium]